MQSKQTLGSTVFALACLSESFELMTYLKQKKDNIDLWYSTLISQCIL